MRPKTILTRSDRFFLTNTKVCLIYIKEKLSNLFFLIVKYKIKAKIENSDYHPKDMERIHKDNEWIKAFWKNGLEEHNRAADLIDEVLDWRKKFGANGL